MKKYGVFSHRWKIIYNFESGEKQGQEAQIQKF